MTRTLQQPARQVCIIGLLQALMLLSASLQSLTQQPSSRACCWLLTLCCGHLAGAGIKQLTAVLCLCLRCCCFGCHCSHALPIVTQTAERLQTILSELPQGLFQPLVSLHGLDGDQQHVLQDVDAALKHEYTIRRRMLIERIKVGVPGPSINETHRRLMYGGHAYHLHSTSSVLSA